MTATRPSPARSSLDAAPRPAEPPAKEPKYYGVKRHLLEIISLLPPGSPVPTERDLTARVGTSRTTVRQA